LGAADRKQLLVGQSFHEEPIPIAFPMANRNIHVFAGEIDVMQRCGNSQVDIGMSLRKSAETMHQPFGREVRGRADRQDARTLALDEALGPDRDAIERIANDDQVLATSFRDDQSLTLTIEKLDAKLLFQSLDLVADRALRHAELLSRAREA